MPSVARINVTPVKGMALAHPDRVNIGHRGLEGSRHFYLVDERDELFSGWSFGPLVQVRPNHDPVADTLTLRFPDGSIVSGATDADALGDAVIASFDHGPVPGRIVDGPFAEALSAYAGQPVRLIRCDRPGDAIDVHPVTLVSHASVNALAFGGNHDGDLDPRRFRMNIELADCGPYEEDRWDGQLVRSGAAILRLAGPVPRCVVTTQDPRTGRKDWDTLRQIATQRERDPDGGLPFGMYATVVESGELAVGDAVEPITKEGGSVGAVG
jgi:uncharacterized protein YcbX